MPMKSSRCIGRSRSSAAIRLARLLGQDHLADGVDPVTLEEHVLGAAEADPLGAEAAGDLGIVRRVGVGADLHPADLVGPPHQAVEVLGQLRLDRGHAALDHPARRAVERDPVALADRLAARREAAVRLVDRDLGRADDAALAHAARDHCRVRRHPAAAGQDRLGDDHAVEVLRRGLSPHQDHRLELAAVGGLVGVEDHAPRRRARRRRQTGGENGDLGGRVDHPVQELVELIRVHTLDRLFLRDQPLFDHLDRGAHRRGRGPLAIAGLEQVERAALDGELQVLHVAVVPLEPRLRFHELAVRLREDVLHLLDRERVADAGHDVLTLRVDQELAVEDVLAGRRVAGEGDAGARVVAHVAEDHRLDVHRGAEVLGDPVDLAVRLGARRLPGAEDGLDRAPELRLGLLREGVAGALLDQLLVIRDERPKRLGRELVVERDARLELGRVQQVLEVVDVDVEHDVAVHLDEAAVRVEREALVAAELGERADRSVVEAEVQDGVHHPRHREDRAGSDREEERALRAAELLVGGLLQLPDVLLHLFTEPVRVAVTAEVDPARFGGDREARRYRDADAGHLGQVRALAAEERLHFLAAVGLAVAEEVDVLLGHLCSSFWRMGVSTQGDAVAAPTGPRNGGPVSPPTMASDVRGSQRGLPESGPGRRGDPRRCGSGLPPLI
jgi:hypothetical protein